MKRMTVRNIVLIWLAWVLIVIGFQALATARVQPQWPDNALWWLADYTQPDKYQKGHPYLLEPFMNNQVAWDSEYYLAIAIGGYNDPCAPALTTYISGTPVRCTDKNPASVWDSGKTMSLSYAFLPLYSLLIHLFAIPLSLLGLNAIATATLAGVIVSALGTLAGMLALYDLTYEKLGEDGGMRAVFYLLIFPTSFFFVQVYTEGLFIGLAFTCLAMLKRKRLVYAALLAAAATLTRAVGVALVIPMAVSWIRTREWYQLDMDWRQLYFKWPPRRPIWHALLAFTPLMVYLIWKFSYYGFAFDYVEANAFGRLFLDFGTSVGTTGQVFAQMIAGMFNLTVHTQRWFQNPQNTAYYFTEFFGMAVGLIAILRCMKTDPEVAWFSLAVFLISWGSGQPQGIYRYVLTAPAMFITLARWGKNPVFDRVWTIASLLLMGLAAMAFAFNFWVG